MESSVLSSGTRTISFEDFSEPQDASGYSSDTSVASSSSRKRRYSEISKNSETHNEPSRRASMMFGELFSSAWRGFKRHVLSVSVDENEGGDSTSTTTSTEDEEKGFKDDDDPQTPPPNESPQRTSTPLHVTPDDKSISSAPKPWPKPHDLLVPRTARGPSESQHQLPSPLPSEDEKAPSPKLSHTKAAQRLSNTQKPTVLANSILDTRKPFFRPNAPPRRQRQSFNQAIHLRDKHSAEPCFASKFRGPASRTAHQRASPHKLRESSPATPMGATLSKFGRSFGSVASSVRPFNPRSSIRRHERARRAAAPSGVTKTVQKKPPQEFKRARDNVYRRKNDPLMAEIELLVILKSKAQYQASGLRTKQQVDQELEERNKLIQKLMKEKADKDRFAVAPLDQASMQRTKEIITKASQQQGHSFCTKFRITIAGHDLVKLCPNQWLNDNIIDFYINLITEREKAKGRKVEGMTTHFFTTFERNGYQKVARWLSRKTKEYCRKNIMELDTLLIPINIGGAHWTLGVIAPKQKRVEFWNSLKSSNHSDDVRRYCTLLRKYLMEEAGITELEGWTNYSPEIQPQQNNYADCGVFTVKTAEFRARGAEPAYTPRDAQNLRYRMVLEIVDGELHPVGDDD